MMAMCDDNWHWWDKGDNECYWEETIIINESNNPMSTIHNCNAEQWLALDRS